MKARKGRLPGLAPGSAGRASCLVLCLLMMTLPGLSSAVALAIPSPSPNQVSIATQLTEVQRGSYDGRDYLALHIGGHDVGPSSCRGNILRLDTSSDTGVARQQQLETLAYSAMLTASPVMIVVPLDIAQCVEGRPTFTDLYLLPASP